MKYKMFILFSCIVFLFGGCGNIPEEYASTPISSLQEMQEEVVGLDTTSMEVEGDDSLDVTVILENDISRTEQRDDMLSEVETYTEETIIISADIEDIDNQIEEPTSSSSNFSASVTPDNFLQDVKVNVESAVGEDESIVDVTLEDGDLHVCVDFSRLDPSPFTYEDLVILRTESITDNILELTQYDDLWETITVDFGDVGKITNYKSNIEYNSYGGRYFLSDNFVIE